MLLTMSALYADVFDMFSFGKLDAALNVVVGSGKTQEDLGHLRTQLDLLQKQERTLHEENHTQIEKIKAQIVSCEQNRSYTGQYANRLILTLKSSIQVLNTIRSSHKEWIAILKSHITLLEDYTKDPDLLGITGETKTLYNFDDLKDLGNQIAGQEERLEIERAQKKETELDLENSKKKIALAEKTVKDKVREQAEFSKDVKAHDRHVHIKSEILDAEVLLAGYEKDSLVLKTQEKEAKLALLTDAVFIEEHRLEILKKKLDFIVRISLRIESEDVRQAEEKLKKEKQRYLTVIDSFMQSIEAVTTKEEKLKKELIFLEKSYEEPGRDIQNLTEWVSTVQSFEGYLNLGEMGLKNDELLLLEREADFLKSKTEFEKIKFKALELNFEMIASWYKIKHQSFKTSDELVAEVKKYQDLAAELLRERSINEDKRNTATNRLNAQNRALSNLKNHRDTIRIKYKSSSYDESKYARLLEYFDGSQVLITKQLEVTGNLIEMYSKLLVSLNSSLKHIDAMIFELQRVSLWHRSHGAISQEGLKNTIPDIGMFFSDLHTLSVHSFYSFLDRYEGISGFLNHPFWVLYLLFIAGMLGVLFWGLHYCLPRFAKDLFSVQRDFKGVYIVSRIAGFLCDFVFHYLISIFIWSIGFYYFVFSGYADICQTILFYLFSIPYLLFLSRNCVHRFIALNQTNNYDILNESFQPRFATICSSFLYATIIILFFRESFLLGGYSKSELPNILLALYSIIVRGLLLTFIRKEDLLSIVPSKTSFWAFIWNIINDYYYVLLAIFIFIMVLSDTHIGGYDNLMTYIFWGILGTGLVIRMLFLLYGFVRRTSVLIFFSSEREVLRERFYLAKTWYSLVAIFLLFFFFFLGLWLVAWFWGKAIPLDSLAEFFTQKKIIISIAENGQRQQVSVLDLLSTFSFIPLAFIVASVIDKFLLYRLFGMLLVDPGVHNTVSIISYYFSVIFVITIGLWYEGFGFLIVYYMGPLFLGMAWALRDVFNDFVAYFIILVQRPLKVGDYIRLDNEVMGVVRRITPRSVVLRRQNSYSIIVPNSRIMRDVVNNWDYSRSFIAFPDIMVSIRYFEDPAFVRELLLQAITSTDNVLKTPAPVIRLEEFNANGFSFLVRAFISSEKTLEQWEIASQARFAIVKNLRAHGIDLSFPVQIIHIKNDTDK